MISLFSHKHILFHQTMSFQKLTINSVVPQGSILELVLFLLYINDIPQPLTNSHIHLYADNTSIFYQHEEVKGIENVLNKKSVNVCEWFLDNHFGVDKLNYYFL